MGLVNKFLDQISSAKELDKFKPYQLQVVTPRYNFKTEEEILTNIIKGKDRLTEAGSVGKITLQVYSETMKRYIFTATLQEFPSCCGKLMMHAIRFPDVNYSGDDLIKWSDKAGSLIISNVLELIKDISYVLQYSSVDFIVSDMEQPFLLKSLKDSGLKEASSFKNRRNEYKHTCYTFTIDFPKVMNYHNSTLSAQAVTQ